MFDIGGAEFFCDIIHVYIIMCAHALFYVCKAQQKFLNLKFVLQPKKLLQKWLKCGSKNPFSQLKYL